MSVAENAAGALGKSVDSVESIVNWFVANREDLPIALGVAVAIVLVMMAFRWIGSRLAQRDPHFSTWRGVIGRALGRTSVLFMVAAALDIVVSYTSVPPRLERLADIFFVIAFALQGAVWARELILGAVARRIAEDSESTLGNAAALIRVLVSIAAFAIATIVILDNLGANVTALIAGLGVGGIAIGLAAQGIFSDLFAALSILFDRPFRRGDTIRFDTTVGTVDRIGMKTTRLRSLTGEQIIMSNTKLLEHEIHNFAEGESRRTSLPFGLIYQTPPELLEKVMPLAKAAVESRKGCDFIRCAITGFGPSSIDFELYYDSPGVDIDEVAADRTAIAIGLLKAFAKHGLEIAYPTQTTFTAAPDGTLVMPYPSVTPVMALEPEEAARAVRAGKDRAKSK